jgi:undecaprenyl pyrophosphate phosphatase UppP
MSMRRPGAGLVADAGFANLESLAIAGMIEFLQRRGLLPFAAYCVVFGGILAFVF